MSMGDAERPTVLWDFDGTLAYREGMFSGTLLQILDENVPGHGAKIENLRPHLNYGFPWHNPEVPHLDLSPEDWWAGIESIFVKAFEAMGVDSSKAKGLARLSRERYVNPLDFKLYEDTIPALTYLRDRGYKHIILSNHVPELPNIVEGIGLSRLISKCISSANAGYEKPNPEIFRVALNSAGNPKVVWMVGDSATADVKGAEAVGIKSILVRSEPTNSVHRYAPGLLEAANIIISEYYGR
jgi:putative hydrolase of the HAD superfamily